MFQKIKNTQNIINLKVAILQDTILYTKII